MSISLPWKPLRPAEPRDSAACSLYDTWHPHGWQMWINATYTVTAICIDARGWTGLVQLSVRRNDRAPCTDWRDFQRIKDQICGPEREGCELYPAQSRLVDNANQYHIWVLPLGERFAFGFEGRSVSDAAHPLLDLALRSIAPNAVQRDLPADWIS